MGAPKEGARATGKAQPPMLPPVGPGSRIASGLVSLSAALLLLPSLPSKPLQCCLYQFDRQIIGWSIGLRPRLAYNCRAQTNRRTDLTLTMAHSLKTSRDNQAAHFTVPFTPHRGGR